MNLHSFALALFVALHGCATPAAGPRAVTPPEVEIAPPPEAPASQSPPDEVKAQSAGGELHEGEGRPSTPRPTDLDSPEGKLHAEALGDIRRGDEASARKKLRRILREHPNSPTADFAKITLAELFFEDGKLRQAEAFLEQALAAPDDELAGYARYRLAWTRLALGKHTHALSDAVAALRLAAKGAASSTSLTALHREMERTLPLFYVHAGRASKAKAFFAHMAATPSGAQKMLVALAVRYEEVGKVRDAIVVHRALAGGPKADACPHLRRIAELYHLVGDAAAATSADREVTQAGCP